MIQISGETLAIITGLIFLGGTVFSVFFYFQKPQIALEKRVSKSEDEIAEIQKQINTIRDDHTKNTEAMQKDIKELTSSVNELSKTVVRLATIIEERIPKGSPNLTPAGT